MTDTPKPAKESPEYTEYLRKKLQDLKESELYAKLYGDDAWALTCKAEARKVEQGLQERE
jgi:hypothetical protein